MALERYVRRRLNWHKRERSRAAKWRQKENPDTPLLIELIYSVCIVELERVLTRLKKGVRQMRVRRFRSFIVTEAGEVEDVQAFKDNDIITDQVVVISYNEELSKKLVELVGQYAGGAGQEACLGVRIATDRKP